MIPRQPQRGCGTKPRVAAMPLPWVVRASPNPPIHPIPASPTVPHPCIPASPPVPPHPVLTSPPAPSRIHPSSPSPDTTPMGLNIMATPAVPGPMPAGGGVRRWCGVAWADVKRSFGSARCGVSRRFGNTRCGVRRRLGNARTTQGRHKVPTLGFVTQSRWDWGVSEATQGHRRRETAATRFPRRNAFNASSISGLPLTGMRNHFNCIVSQNSHF